MRGTALFLTTIACIGLGGCPAPRYYHYVSAESSSSASKSIKGKWEFGPRKISYKVGSRVTNSPIPELILHIENNSDVPVYYEWSSSTISDGRITVSPGRTGPYDQLSSATGISIPPQAFEFIWVAYEDSTASIRAGGTLVINPGAVRSEKGDTLFTIPAFVVHSASKFSAWPF